MGVVNKAETYLRQFLNGPFIFLYRLLQSLLDYFLAPAPPPPGAKLDGPKIAVIGAGLTGVSSAAHCVGHGADVTLFEAGGREHLGGIWAKVNNTSGLQIHSLMYRFHPSVNFSGGYPKKSEIVSQVEKLWKNYGLESKTKFNEKVTKVYKDKQGRWIINNESNGRFDGVLACIGTCGDPKMPHVKGQEKFKGPIYHSSQLDGKDAKDKNVLIIGGGASAIEALEYTAKQKSKQSYILSRSEKWIIPRNPIIEIILSLNVFGAEVPLSWVPEQLLRLFFYRDLADIAPPPDSDKGLYMETPMVNSHVFDLIRDGKAEWLRGDISHFAEDGIVFNHRSRGTPKGGPGREKLIKGDICIMATGFERPSLGFLPDECFEEHYEPPNWYLQVFPPEEFSICCNNCTYLNAIGTVGNYHIGIYTRFLLMFLADPLTSPSSTLAKKWIDFTRWVKERAPTGAFDFFTYSELLYWFVFVIVINPFRWKWAPFVLMGVGEALPRAVVKREEKIRKDLGLKGENVLP